MVTRSVNNMLMLIVVNYHTLLLVPKIIAFVVFNLNLIIANKGYLAVHKVARKSLGVINVL